MKPATYDSRPTVSVILPVRNGHRYVWNAIASLLQQTFSDIEVLVIDDESSDGTCEILETFMCRDPRIRVWRNRDHQGIAHTLNTGLSLARGRYVARLDADDIAKTDRIEKQVNYLEKHPELHLLGTALEMISEEGEFMRLHLEPIGWISVLFHTLFGTPFAHPSMLMRSDLFNTNGYRYREVPAQDYDLWTRLLNGGYRGDNLAEPLTFYRVHAQSDSYIRAAAHADGAENLASHQLHTYVPHLAGVCGGSRLRLLGHCLLTGNPLSPQAEDNHLASIVLELLDNFLAKLTLSENEGATALHGTLCRRIDHHLSALKENA